MGVWLMGVGHYAVSIWQLEEWNQKVSEEWQSDENHVYCDL